MRRILFILTLMLLLVSVVSAAEVTFKTIAVRSDIDSGESGQFLITLTSNELTIKEYRMYSPSVEWDVPEQILKAYPKTDTSYKLIVTPSKYVTPGKVYGIKLNFKEVDTEEIVHSEIIEVNVKSSDKAVSEYRPSVRLDVDLPETIDPREEVVVKVRLENQNLLDLSGLILKVTSGITELQAEQYIDLIPLGEKIIEIGYDLDPLQEPGEYKVEFKLLRGSEIIEAQPKSITISEIKPSFGQDDEESGFLFKTVITKKITSSSNKVDTQTITIPTSTIKSWFTSTEPEGEVIETDGEKVISILVTLNPGETKEVVIVENYRLLLYILIVALILLFIHLRYKSPITIRKGISDVGMSEGGISKLKITLEIINNAKKTIKNVVVTDYIPNIAEIEKEFAEGTLRPTRIFKHRSKGIVLKWEIDELAEGDDRLISYNVKSKLSIVGNLKMPRARIDFKKDKRKMTSYSNQVGVSS